MSHTPGPWTVIPPEESYHKPLVKRGMEGGFAVSGLSQDREIADARLIAAAPDLLLALERALGCIRGLIARNPVRDIPETLAEVQSAIKKAMGE